MRSVAERLSPRASTAAEPFVGIGVDGKFDRRFAAPLVTAVAERERLGEAAGTVPILGTGVEGSLKRRVLKFCLHAYSS